MTKFTIVFLLFYNFQVNAGDKKLDEPLLVVTESWPPYNYLAADGTVKGLASEVVEQILQATDITYETKVYPWARAYNLALSKPNVAIYSIIQTPSRAPLFHWLCPLIKVKYFIFKLSERKDIKIEKFDDLKNYKQGVLRSSFFNQILTNKGFIEGKHFNTSSSNNTSLRELLNRRIDVLAGTKQFIDSELKKLQLPAERLKAIYEIKHQAIGDICMAISLKTPQQRVNKIKQAHQKLYLLKN